MPSGVYALFNMRTNMRYVGSSINLFDRVEQHFHQLEENRHYNYKLQKAYWEHPDDFAFIILEITDPEKRREREQVWIDRLKRFYPLYNIQMQVKPLPQGDIP